MVPFNLRYTWGHVQPVVQFIVEEKEHGPP